jgi:hypothetical protein
MNNIENLSESSDKNQEIKSNKKFKKNLIFGIVLLLLSLISLACLYESIDLYSDFPILIVFVFSGYCGARLSLKSWNYFYKKHLIKEQARKEHFKTLIK